MLVEGVGSVNSRRGEGWQSRTSKDEMRAERITIGGKTVELR
jgi:hypothetical protein